MATALETAELIRQRYQQLRAVQEYSESDTIDYLINPVLDHFGFTAEYRMRENQQDKNRPDFSLWQVPVAQRTSTRAKSILEAKSLGHDLSGRGRSRTERPKEQLQRYVNGYEFSQAGTLGVLTDGAIWHIVRKNATEKKAPLVSEFNLFGGTLEQTAALIQEIEQILKAEDQTKTTALPQPKVQRAIQICRAIADGKSPSEILSLLSGNDDALTHLTEQVQLQGKGEAAETYHWAEYAFTKAGHIRTEQKDFDQEATCVAVLRATDAESQDDQILYRGDTAVAAESFAKVVPINMSVLLMIQPSVEGSPNNARLAVHYQGHTGMTAEFNPSIPSPRDLRTIQALYDQLVKKTPVNANSLTDVVAAKSVRKEFYEKIATGWTLRQQRKAKGSKNKKYQYREAVLRHLIRTIFAWILKEDGKLPPEPFDEAFARREAPGTYHKDILTFLFHQRLNRGEEDREDHPNPQINEAMQDTRFLNGSLFALHDGDNLLELSDDDYFATGDEPGLFTILGEYEWTASEHTPQSSEQTIDPEVLSNLFENLIAATTFGDGIPDQMPAGTYYTPADIAQEMVKDALTEAVADHAPKGWTKGSLRDLFGHEDAQLPALNENERIALIEGIRQLTIFDPAVGSGEFPFLTMLAIKKGLRNLGVDESDAAITRDIISRQIFAQDINPMAVQVTRLRLFISIMAAETPEESEGNFLPLPNLEAKVVCANTLSTAATRDWSPFGAGTFQSTMDEVKDSLMKVAEIRRKWQSAHDEVAKQAIRQEDEQAREQLRAILKGKMGTAETAKFAKHALLDPDAQPAEVDARLLFYDPERTSFDIVIGNPPYESINKDLSPPAKATKEQKADLAKKKKARKKAFADLKYTTTAGNDLYNLMAEVALTLARPDGGVVTLIVPLSICFGQDQRDTRRRFESECDRIILRSQDIRPDQSFHDSPVAHPSNSQRTTIVTARIGGATPSIEISGANKWPTSERHEYLTSRGIPLIRKTGKITNTKLDSQWERIPTKEIQGLITKMKECTLRIVDLKSPGDNDYSIGYPPSARYFITIAPAGKLNRGEKILSITGNENIELAMAAANGHAAYAWWKTYGDAFHVNPHEVETIPIPDLWMQDGSMKEEARKLGRMLIEAITPENIESNIAGTNSIKQDSLNFHECAAHTVKSIDKLFLKALELEEEPLLETRTESPGWGEGFR